MTKEQEVIEMLEDIKNNTWTTKYIMSSDSKKAETVLNMLKEKDELYHKALGDLAKADRENIQLKKQIDLMADRIEWLCKSNGILLDEEHDENFTQKDVKQYFERKSEEWKK